MKTAFFVTNQNLILLWPNVMDICCFCLPSTNSSLYYQQWLPFGGGPAPLIPLVHMVLGGPSSSPTLEGWTHDSDQARHQSLSSWPQRLAQTKRVIPARPKRQFKESYWNDWNKEALFPGNESKRMSTWSYQRQPCEKPSPVKDQWRPNLGTSFEQYLDQAILKRKQFFYYSDNNPLFSPLN